MSAFCFIEQCCSENYLQISFCFLGNHKVLPKEKTKFLSTFLTPLIRPHNSHDAFFLGGTKVNWK